MTTETPNRNSDPAEPLANRQPDPGPATTTATGERPSGLAGRREWVGLVALILPCLLVTMDLAVLLLAVPSLVLDLGATATEQLWVTDIYGFLMAGSLIAMGALGDRFGRRRILMIGAAGFGATSLLATLATNPEVLIAARGLQGIAGAALLPSVMALVFGMFQDAKQRTAALGAVMGSFALGAALGPIVGGALLEAWSWQAVFVPNVIACLVVLALGKHLLPEVRQPLAPRVDLTSAALSIAGVLSLIYAVKVVAQHGFDPGVGVYLALGVAALGWFARRQLSLTHPLVDLGMFRRTPFSVAVGVSVTSMFVTYGVTFFTSQFLQLVAGLSPLHAGLWGLPPVVAMMIASGAVVPALSTRIRPAYLVAGGMVVTAIGLAWLAQSDPGTGAAAIAGILVVVVVGLAPVTTIGMNLIVGTAPAEQVGSVSGLGQAANELGGALGIALLGSLGTAVYQHEATAPGSSLGAVLATSRGLPTRLIEDAQLAFTDGMSDAALTGAALLALTACVAAVTLRHLPAASHAPATGHSTNDTGEETAAVAAA